MMDRPTDPIRVDLIYDRDCPNVNRARLTIREALDAVAPGVEHKEWDRADPATPTAFRAYASPSVLVNGHDVERITNEDVKVDASSCRIYRDADGHLQGAPTSELIAEAIRRAEAA